MDFDYTSDFSVEEFLEQSQRSEEKRLEDELNRIEEQLESRDQVHEEVVDELESKLDWYRDRLEKLYKQGRGRNNRRDRLKSKISSFYDQLRNEKLEHWQDKQELEMERRQLLRELDEINDVEITDLL